MKQKKKSLFGMHSLLAVIALMLAVTIYASCSSDDDDYDNGWVELGTKSKGTRGVNGEGGNPGWVDSSVTSCIRAWDTIIIYKILPDPTYVEDDGIYATVHFHWNENERHWAKLNYEINIVNQSAVTINDNVYYHYVVDTPEPYSIMGFGINDPYLCGYIILNYHHSTYNFNGIALHTDYEIARIDIHEDISHLLYQDTTAVLHH